MGEIAGKVKTDSDVRVFIKEMGILGILVDDCKEERDRVVKPSLFIHSLYSSTMELIVCARNCSRHWRYSSDYARESACLLGAGMTKGVDKFLNKMEIEGPGNRNESECFGKILTSILDGLAIGSHSLVLFCV